LGSPTVANAQTDLGNLNGRITDPQGAVVPQATVTITSSDNGFTRTVVTNGVGIYSIPALQAGRYHVTAAKGGFQVSATDTRVIVGQTIAADFQLAVGAETQTVNVSSVDSSVAIQTESHEMNQLVDSKHLLELPTNSRSPLAAALLGPGSQSGADEATGANGAGGSALFYGQIGNTVILSGQSLRSTTFLQDGVQNFNLLSESANILATVEATQEINVVTVGSPAKYDQPGLVNVITKSGTNRFHGAVYDFLQNDDLNATPFFSTTKTPIRFNTFGANVNGPIVRNKLFFLFDYSGLRIGNTSTTRQHVPTVAERAGDFSADGATLYDPNTYNATTGTISQFTGNMIPASRESNFAKLYVAYFPLPTVLTTAPGAINYTAPLKATQSADQYLGRVDLNLTSRQHIMGSYSHFNNAQTSPTIVPGLFGIIYGVSGNNVGVEHTWAKSPTLVNVVRFGYNKANVQRSQQGAGLQPYLENLGLQNMTPISAIEVPPLVSITACCGEGDPYSPQGAIQNRFQFADEVDYQKAKHSIAVGAELIYTRFDGKWTILNNGEFVYSPIFTSNHSYSAYGGGYGLADFFLGLPQYAVAATGQPVGNFRQKNIAFYAQDDWKLAPRLVLNLGLRYQVTTPPSDTGGRAGTVDLSSGNKIPGTWKSNYGDFAPRIGFSWNAIPNTVIRGGYGIYYAMTPYNNLSFVLANGTNYVEQVNAYSWPNPTPTETSIVAHPAANSATPFTLGSVMKDTSIQQIDLNIEHSFAKHYLASIAYVGDLSRHTSVRLNANQAYPQSPTTPTAITARRQYTNVGDVFAQYNIGTANYHGMQAKLERTFTNGLSFLMSYTYSRAMDELSADGASLLDRFNPRLNYAPSDFDRTHQLTTSALLELPFGPGHMFMNANNWVNRDVLGGWQVSEITRFATGRPVPVDATDLTNSGGIQQFYALKTCNPNVFPTGQSRSKTKWFNTACFAQPGTGVWGGARNAVRQPREDGTDISAMKTIAFENPNLPRIQFRADLFNVFNHPQLLFGETALTSSLFGQLTGQQNSSRTIQASVRIAF
jgi:outer membrane receptor protein involved in Fe transport